MMKHHFPYNQERIIVAIDGPAGAGKSTIAKALALDLNYLYVDTGSMYRAIAYACFSQRVDCQDREKLQKLLASLEIEIIEKDSERFLLLNGKDVTKEIRDPVIYNTLAIISTLPEVRQFLMNKQRDFSKKYSVVMEGRDIGTVVFPEAHYKFFLTANPEVRAKRRYLEFKHKGIQQDEATILKEILERDAKDENRSIAPLKKAADAIEVDTSTKNARMVVDELLYHIFQKNKAPSTSLT